MSTQRSQNKANEWKALLAKHTKIVNPSFIDFLDREQDEVQRHLAKSQIHDMSANMLALKATVEEQVLDHDRTFETDAKMVRFRLRNPDLVHAKKLLLGLFRVENLDWCWVERDRKKKIEKRI